MRTSCALDLACQRLHFVFMFCRYSSRNSGKRNLWGNPTDAIWNRIFCRWDLDALNLISKDSVIPTACQMKTLVTKIFQDQKESPKKEALRLGAVLVIVCEVGPITNQREVGEP